MNWLTSLLSQLTLEDDDRAAADVLLLQVALPGAAGALAFLSLCRLIGESAASDESGLLTDEDDETDGLLASIGLLVIHCFSALRAPYPTRTDAQNARSTLAERAEPVIEAAGLEYGPDLSGWLIALVGETVWQISEIAATRAPLVRVETQLSLPSSLIAYDLYGDPSRGAELVTRNGTGTPLVMPVVLEAASR